METLTRHLPVGAEVEPAGGVHFRVWAPDRNKVRVHLESGPSAPNAFLLEKEGGYFAGLSTGAAAGTIYRFELDDDPTRYPDPASRYQPDGPHGPSQVIDPAAFQWTDGGWRGVSREGHIIYEMHIGTFSKEGTWGGAQQELEELAKAGITLIEVMPVADFPGRFGWGYDGVDLFAPTWLYGHPDEMRAFVNEAHGHGMGVILDVVYNHLGPDGNYLAAFAAAYFSEQYHNDWGKGLNFDGAQSAPVREFFLSNARYWIEEFHLDGLRLDATQDVKDASPTHIIAEIAQVARAAAGNRGIFLIAENEPQETRLVRRPEDGGYGLDALWNDDFHHSALVALSGRNEAYYSDYSGNPQEFVSAAKYGYLYQGQWYRWQDQPRGTPTFDLEPTCFINFIQNHDQVANSARGERPNLVTTQSRYRAMTALLMLMPGTPMLFQGQEFGATTPFLYFCDHKAEISKMVREGRAKFLGQFRSLSLPEMQPVFADPGNPHTFETAKLDFSQRLSNAGAYQLHKDLIALRRGDPVFSKPRRRGVDGAVLVPDAFALRYFSESHGDRLVVVNFGTDLYINPNPEPLLAPPLAKAWHVIWSSEDPKYGGLGTFPPDQDDNWRIPGNAAVVLSSEEGN
ncbi:MAG TPA: malto-oligosyltrehalose trehalohydrolase [Bryobacteraceae bacterium]|nr:malto-oligosyltrehalose trehalohydrolase [Bryobacteraceae bacterium]